MTSCYDTITANIGETVQVLRALLEQDLYQISGLADLLIATFRAGGKVVLFGNGGSAADAQHVAGELVSRFRIDREGLPALALTTDTSILTGIGNDFDFQMVFARQVQALVQPGDVAVGISTSGNSANILAGIRAAGQRGATTVGFTGRQGGELKKLVDHCFCAPSDSTPRIQEAHIAVWHAVCDAVEQELFGC
jgi:D-sedoheptulose 7-phosphate isomerase